MFATVIYKLKDWTLTFGTEWPLLVCIGINVMSILLLMLRVSAQIHCMHTNPCISTRHNDDYDAHTLYIACLQSIHKYTSKYDNDNVEIV